MIIEKVNDIRRIIEKKGYITIKGFKIPKVVFDVYW